MTNNPTLMALRDRRSANLFTPEPITDEQLEAILEAGRWAPSAHNSQPWSFVVVTDPETRSEMGALLKNTTLAWNGFATAPAMIVVAVDPSRDPDHFVEDGAVAAQNLCLAAHSLGLASSWAGVYARRGAGQNVERSLKRLLSIPRSYRLIAVIPIGIAAHTGRGSRRPLTEIVSRGSFHADADASLQTPAPGPDPESPVPPAAVLPL